MLTMCAAPPANLRRIFDFWGGGGGGGGGGGDRLDTNKLHSD